MTFIIGKFPQSLANLTKLEVLDLGYGVHMETDTLEWMSKLKSLKYLDLGWIDWSQAFDALTILQRLQYVSVLSLSKCGLGNSHLVSMRNSTLSSSTAIRHLDLSENNFTGGIPSFVQSLSSVRFLDLSNNQFRSLLPSWIDDELDLEYISLSHNSFHGPFPEFIQNLSFLTSLDLSYNQYSSSIPSWLAEKTSLQFISLSSNAFERVDEGVMNIISSLCDLKLLDLSNNQLQEDVLESAAGFSRCSRYGLQYLYMQNNNMSGQLPTDKNMLALQELDLSLNNFEAIPPFFGQLFSLESVNLSYNKLTVLHQTNLANLSSLSILDVSSNSLDLNISTNWRPPFQLWSLQMPPCRISSQFPKWILSQGSITELDLSHTGLFGSLPKNLHNFMPYLESLRLANNNISGSIPRSLCKLPQLMFLDLQHNKLSGKIPDCWENSQMFGLDLSSNKLSGHIPSSLTVSRELQLLSLSDNLLEGELPSSLSNCTGLMVVDVGKNNLHMEVPSWSGANCISLQILILRDKFNGFIPPQLCSLHKLQIIDLASNNLSGTTPPCFGHFVGMGSTRHSTIAPAR